MTIADFGVELVARLSSFGWRVQDYQIPKPPNPPPNTQQDVASQAINNDLPPIRLVNTGPSTTEILIAVLVAIVAAVLFYLLRGVLYNSLIARRVRPTAASGAAWALFVFLTATAWTAITGFLVDLWTNIPFLIGGSVVVIATLIFFLVSYFCALEHSK
jgi:hypothetical protein